jgi:hypothetical protein
MLKDSLMRTADRLERLMASPIPTDHHSEGLTEMMTAHRSEQTTVPMTELARRWEGSTGSC